MKNAIYFIIVLTLFVSVTSLGFWFVNGSDATFVVGIFAASFGGIVLLISDKLGILSIK